MPLGPQRSDVPRIRTTLLAYRISAYVTGVFLLLLCAEMVGRYGFEVALELGGPQGFLAFVPKTMVTAFSLSTAVLIVHGWLYVVYLFLDFRLWVLLRWPFGRFVLVALGGVIPFLSFIVEHQIHKQVTAQLADLEDSDLAEARH